MTDEEAKAQFDPNDLDRFIWREGDLEEVPVDAA